MSDDLHEWITDQAEVGEKDSAGQFTLDPARAWDKLGALSLPHEYAWVAKLVQSAVRIGSGMSVLQSRDETLFTWDQPPPWTHEQTLEAVFSVQPVEDVGLGHLAVALRALAASSANYRFSLSYLDGAASDWTGQQLEKSTAVRRGPKPTFVLSVKHKAEGAGAVSGYLAGTVVGMSIAKALQNHAQWSPRRVTLDRREVSNVFADPVFGVSDRRQPMCLLPVPPRGKFSSFRVRAQLKQPELAIESVNLAPDDQALAQAMKTMAEPISALGLVSFFTELHRKVSSDHTRKVYRPIKHPSQMAWVRDGVEVLREDLPFSRSTVALLIVCDAEGLETDISGMVPRDTPAKTRRMTEALKAINEGFPDPDDLQSDYSLSKKVPKAGLGIFLVGAVTLLVSAPLALVVMGVGGCKLASEQGAGTETFDTIEKDFRNLAQELHAYAQPGQSSEGSPVKVVFVSE